MSKFSDLQKGFTKIDELERSLNLKQLQINRLLNITQAINDNISAEDLYQMYNSFLSWEMGVKKMALFVIEDDKWVCTSNIDIPQKLLDLDITEYLTKYQRTKTLDDDGEHALIKEFDIVIPVLHKESPIAYTFIGGFDKNEDMYNKVQFITTITNVIAVAIENKRLFKKQLMQERYRREMELGSDMQKMLIPSELPKGDSYELSSVYKPHLGVGGDYFDFREFDDDKFLFCIADISGKGVAAALLMANFQANFNALLKKREPLKRFIEELNESLVRITNGDKFLTLFIAEFDKKTRVLNYINAGHNPPVMVANGKSELLKAGCTVLGAFDELPVIEEGEVVLDEETLILTFTDGLTDIYNDEQKYFDEDLLRQFAEEHYKKDTESFTTSLMTRIDDFRGDQVYPDDITILICKIFGKMIN